MSELFGGTELQLNLLRNSLSPELLDNFQIIPTRLNEELNNDKIRIAWIHDLEGDPSLDYLKNEGWRKFHLLIFVSDNQMQNFIQFYNIPWSRCLVIKNAINPLMRGDFEDLNILKLIYTPTPHRGLNILIPVFVELLKEFPNMVLDVFSSFKLYGWENRDEPYKQLFKFCEDHPSINYHGAQPQEIVRYAISNSHIFAYPSTWKETSCRCLMEAMSAGLVCVHSNLGALPETAANWTYMYQFQEDLNSHAMIFMNTLRIAIKNLINDKENTISRLKNQSLYVDQVYNWDYRKVQLENLLTQMLNLSREFEKEIVFNYKTL
jgi:glycosyltransferase involved in cell wall biosynthesis